MFDGDDQLPTSMGWNLVGALGTISLAMVPNGLPQKDVDDSKAAIRAAADSFAAIVDGQGYRLPFKPSKKGQYPWGSNSFILNNSIILGLAHDSDRRREVPQRRRRGDELHPGAQPARQVVHHRLRRAAAGNPHHRFWAHQANAKFPSAPPGVVSGGPNSGLQDPYVQAAGLAGCAPQKCFIDNIEAWSANEIAINWNTPLAWVTAFLDEKATGAGKKPAAVKK